MTGESAEGGEPMGQRANRVSGAVRPLTSGMDRNHPVSGSIGGQWQTFLEQSWV